MRNFALSLVLGLILISPFVTHAQDIGDPSQIANLISFVANPETPGPHQNVHIAIEAYGMDLGISNITWKLNGVVVKSGRGITSLDFVTGDIGSRSSVSVNVTTGSGVITQTLDFTPGSVDLIQQGNTYAPPFYKGRTLWSRQSRITLLAIPHVSTGGGELGSASLIYKWTKDGTVLGSSSGTGKNSLTFVDSALSLPTTVTVDVMTNQDTVVGTETLTLASGDPSILVYENNPLYGLLFNREVANSATLNNKEVTFSAIPYFMTGNAKDNPSFSYNWSTNSGGAQSGSKVTYRAPEGAAGSSQVRISVLNTNTLLQGGEKDFLVQFGSQNSL